ncbi:hypothetical protein A9Q99_06300 [Gammaproteobacteria bacterium 45_16_T64]|nr:hypothetical protein A9Q99_06300 [Gammaproteobacteria bacterium 45_16_T64]
MQSVTWVLICNPENRRQRFFTEALRKQRGKLPVVISYADILGASNPVEYLVKKLESIKNQYIHLKIESPGESFEVTKALIILGAREGSKRLDLESAKKLRYDKGRFKYLKEWYFGYRFLLKEIDCALSCWARASGRIVRYVNQPTAILNMLDKYRCQQFLAQRGVATPKLIPVAEDVTTLLDQLRMTKQCSVFIKPKYGSSATGVIALRVKPDGSKCVARTSLELSKTDGVVQCYNSLKVRTYHKEKDIAALYSTVLEEGAYIEQWLPKPQLKGQNFDLRVVVINGKATHHVTRCSNTPMTNLHLGNQRGDILHHKSGAFMLKNAYDCAENVASLSSGAGCFGADIILSSSRSRAHIIELNAFGDLLPGIHYQSKDTYETQVDFLPC